MPPHIRFSLLAFAVFTLAISFSGFNTVHAQVPGPGEVLISEFRTRGLSKFDEFVEIYNNTDHDFTVTDAVNPGGANSGWAVVGLGPSGTLNVVFVIPEGTVIPARSHFLAANNNGDQNQNGYSLFPYAVADFNYGSDNRDDGGLAIFNNVTVFDLAHRVDAAGFTSAGNSANALLVREGTGLPGNFGNNDNAPNVDVQYSFVRKQKPNPAFPATSSTPFLNSHQDTGNNANDFIFVSSTGGTFGGVVSKLGFPGPENMASPGGKDHNVQFIDSALDPNTAISQPPNRVRILRANCLDCDNTSSNLGKLLIRRRWTNMTDVCVTELRWRIVDLTTLNNRVAAEADLRFLSSSQLLAPADCVGCNGVKLEKEESQAMGGGINASARFGNNSGVIDLSANPIPPGGQILTQFSYGVQMSGGFRAYVNVEARTRPQEPGGGCIPSAAPVSETNVSIYEKSSTSTKTKGSR